MRIVTGLLGLLLFAIAHDALPQPYPAKPIRFIVPFVPGGPTDTQARWAAQQLNTALGQSVIVENRPGAGGVPGTEAVVKSAPDGYTLLAGNPGPLTIAPSVRAQMPYDTLRDLAPIMLIARSASCLCAHPSLPAKGIKDFVALAKAQPGKINYGTSGVGTVGHLATELFATQAGIKLNHVPYKGAAQYTVDLLAGNIEVALNQFAISAPLVKAGKLRCLGATSRTRSLLLPDVPTIAEQGIKGFESYNWNGVLAPAGTPRAIINRIHDVLAKQLGTPESRELYIGQGHELGGDGPEEYAAFINMIGSIAYGGAEMGELHKIGTLLKDQEPEDDEAWFNACVKVADGVRAYAEKFEKGGHRFSAAHAYLRACNYYQMAERFRTPKDKKALDAFRTGVECFRCHAALTDVTIETVEVPFKDGSLPGYFVHAQNAGSKRTPCVVFFDGLDVTKEIQYVRGVPDLIKRGVSVLVMDGPGTGEAIRFRGHYLRHDYEAAGSAYVDYLEKRDDVDAKKIGIVAISLGGYYSPRCAAMEPRYAACIAWGAQWDYYATWKKRVEAGFKTPLSVPGHHIMWILGVDSLDAALKKLEPFRLDGVMQEMRCPFLLVHGADDEQIPLADAQKQFDACGSKDKTFRVYTAEEGGAQHCQRDYLTLVVADMWNWFEDKLVRG